MSTSTVWPASRTRIASPWPTFSTSTQPLTGVANAVAQMTATATPHTPSRTRAARRGVGQRNHKAAPHATQAAANHHGGAATVSRMPGTPATTCHTLVARSAAATPTDDSAPPTCGLTGASTAPAAPNATAACTGAALTARVTGPASETAPNIPAASGTTATWADAEPASTPAARLPMTGMSHVRASEESSATPMTAAAPSAKPAS